MSKTLKNEVLFACLLLVLSIQQALANDDAFIESTERIIWDKRPLKITLPVGKERIITFPSPVWADMPSDIQDKLRTQINSRSLYWLADKSFKTHRIEIGTVDGRTIFLIDLQAKKGGSTEPIDVEIKNHSPQNNLQHKSVRSRAPRKKSPGYILLSRFAAQQLYAPGRLLTTPQGVHRVPVNRETIRHLIRGTRVRATPIAAWRNAAHYVTAIELKNQTGGYITLDPRMIRGQWKAATFQHVRLHPAGSESDTTALYLISDRPFHEVI